MSERINFGKIKEGAEPPNLIEIQLDSYIEFLQTDVQISKRKETGLQAVFKEVFPIESYDEKAVLDFILSKFKPDEVDELKKVFKRASTAMQTTIEKGPMMAMNEFNRG